MRIPDGYVLVPVDSIKAIDMGWAYLDAAREAEPEKSHSFSHAGYRAMVAAAPPAEFPAYDEAKERELFESRWGFTNDEQEIYFVPELNCYGSSRVNDAANNKSSAWYWWQACAKSRAGIQS